MLLSVYQMFPLNLVDTTLWWHRITISYSTAVHMDSMNTVFDCEEKSTLCEAGRGGGGHNNTVSGLHFLVSE